MLGFAPLSGLPLSDVFPAVDLTSLGVEGTGLPGSLASDTITIQKTFTGVEGTGQIGLFSRFDANPHITGVEGTGQVSALHNEEVDKLLLGVHGTGQFGLVLRVAPTIGAFITGLAHSVANKEVDKTPLGVHATGVANIVFSQAKVEVVAREVLHIDQSTSSANVEMLVREAFLTEHSGNAVVNIDTVVREVHTKNQDSIINTASFVREIVLLNDNSLTKINSADFVREVVMIDAASDIQARSQFLVRELLVSTTNAPQPSSVLVVT